MSDFLPPPVAPPKSRSAVATIFAVAFILAVILLVAPWALMVALGILGVSVSFLEAIALSWLLGFWYSIVSFRLGD